MDTGFYREFLDSTDVEYFGYSGNVFLIRKSIIIL